MKVCGIIAEYNPFHNGHAYQLRYTKEELGADYIIVAMSGDFVQRGTPALLPKHVRTKMALQEGADLVLELPAAFSCASAEYFARGGVQLLDRLGVVDTLCFGSETGNTDMLMQLADLLVREPEGYLRHLKEELSRGQTFPVARSAAAAAYFSEAGPEKEKPFLDGSLLSGEEAKKILSSPNNILGIEYCKALLRQNSAIRPAALKRKGAGYHQAELKSGEFPSASAIRKAFTQGMGEPASCNSDEECASVSGKSLESLACGMQSEAHTLSDNSLETLACGMPPGTFRLLEEAWRQNAFLTEADLDPILQYRLFEEDAGSLCGYLDVSDALARRIIHCRNEYRSFSQFAALLKTKEITQTRIQRALLHILLHIRTIPAGVPYARVLGFRRESAPLLKEIKANSSLPLLTKLADAPTLLDEEGARLLAENTFASNIYEGILSRKAGKSFTHEYQKPLVIL